MINPRFLSFACAIALPLAALADPVWIWTKKNPEPKETADFRTEFEVSGEVKSAVLKLTCDNGAIVLINGARVVENTAWEQPARANVKSALRPGKNEILVQAHNSGGIAALIGSLAIQMNDGKSVLVETSDQWLAAPHGGTDWKPAVMIAKYGNPPWGLVLDQARKAAKADQARKSNDAPNVATDPKDITAPPGFKVELLYTVPREEQGSWVSLTVDKKGRLLCGDQYGAIYRLTPPPIGSGDKSVVERVDAKIGGAHGLLYAHDSLYVMLDEGSAPESKGMKQGLYRLKDKDGDDHFGEPVLLSACAGSGEHGPHSIQLSPDGKSIFFNCGNHTKLPENLSGSRAAMGSWDEDHILPRMWDANGHARGILAPGGYICQTDPEGKKVEMFCSGFRNEFDFAFDANGEMFAYDADMEWDIGAPWYRPTRINHCVSGGDYGWRSGSGKWPSYYEDSLPAVVDIGPGSPTGVTFGTGAKFPAKYQRALFGNDWTYGTMYAIHFEPSGASFKGVKEEFIFAKPLPLTDVVINQHDGAMYFAIGGRRTQSAVYRVTYEGKESTAKAKPYELPRKMVLRGAIEQFHAGSLSRAAGRESQITASAAIENPELREALETAGKLKLRGSIAETLWPMLGSSDRNLRFAARVRIEREPVESWGRKVLIEKDPQTLIEAAIALARVGRTASHVEKPDEKTKPAPGSSSAAVGPTNEADGKLQARILEALGRLEFNSLNLDLQLQLLRAYQLAFTRLGKPDAAACAKVAAHLEPLYPAKDASLNRELCQLLIFLDSKTVAAKTLGLMATAHDDDEAIATDALLERNTGYAKAANEAHQSRPNRQQIAYMFALRNCSAGWTPELRQTYFSWFPHARTWKGGNSFKGFIENTRKEALAKFVPPDEMAKLDELSSRNETVVAASITPPKGPGKAYTTDEIVRLVGAGLKGRNFDSGKNLYGAIMCAACHHFAGDGGNIGPDLTGVGNRYTLRDLVENITEPSKVISDQYGSHQVEKTDGSIVVGRIISEDGSNVNVMTNPFAPNVLVPIPRKDVKNRKDYPVSMMPPGLINALNEDELKDLLAYLLSGGSAADKIFSK